MKTPKAMTRVWPELFGRTKSAEPRRECTYLERDFRSEIPRRRIQTVFELGSRDALDAIDLSRFYKAKVYAFECNPDSIRLCEKNLVNETEVVLVKQAVWSEDGRVRFFPVDLQKSIDPNVGASSCFRLNFKERSRAEWRREICLQYEIEVEATRIDTFCKTHGISSIDLVCMDLEGAELHALAGFGEMLETVGFIITEVMGEPMHYGGTPLFQDVTDFLEERGFRCRVKMLGELFGNALFVRERHS